ncbi:MAG: protein kinase domain-containing protein, partial [Thermaurantiacus sp.]
MRTSAGPSGEAEALACGTRLGAWAVDAPIAAGGMGQVYRARRADGAYEQAVAVKLIHDRAPERVARFAAERQRLAEMDHPGIARIIDGGTHGDGRPWMAMELVEGAPIMPQAGALPRERRLRLFLDLCAGVAHAHGRLVLHRDLKSANVLLDANGTVRLIDFGIAALTEGEAAPGAAYTPATAAPEQIRGEPPSVQTDVFALGCILHELLTGKVPARDDRQGVILDRAGIAGADLEAILGRATAFTPEDRYPTAQALADDVCAVREHRPVAARNGGAAYRAGKFVRRFPMASALAAAFVAALVGGILVSLSYARTAEAEAEKARTELARAEYFLERNDVVNNAREAYADALQAMFASDADVERLTRLLKDRWQEAHDNRAANPDQAASLSYSISRHFLFRNDYVTALEILEPWISEGYGPQGLLQQGRINIAFAYQYTGRRDQAEVLFRQALREIEGSFEAFTPDHAGRASDLASLTREPADLAHAETVLLRVASQPDLPPDIESYLWNQTALVRLWQAKHQGALAAWRRSVALIEANPLAAMAGRDTRRLNLANAELHYGGGPEAAERIIRRVLEQDLAQSGLNREIGRARAILGEIALVRGDSAMAAREMAAAASIIERFAGRQAGDRVIALSGLVEAEVRRGRLAAADVAEQELDAYDAESGGRHPLGAISRALLAAA